MDQIPPVRLMDDAAVDLAMTISDESRPWFPYLVPADVSPTALAMMPASRLVLAFQDTATAAQRAATVDEELYDAETYDLLLDTRDRLAREIHDRLLQVEHQVEHRRLREQAIRNRAPRPRLAG